VAPSRKSELVVGLDLAGSPGRDTGFCVLKGPREARASVLHTDSEILAKVEEASPDLTLIDAPLSLPRGRATIDDRSGPHFRECDRELRRLGIRFFPLTLGPMRMLTERGMRLAAIMRARGFPTEEGYPGGAQDLLGLPRKQGGTEPLQKALLRLGLGGDLSRRPLTHDELDGVTLAWVARAYLQGRAKGIGDPSEGIMILPSIRPRSLSRPS
jgi:predicted nuclease with RNAse H fold